MKRFTNYYTPPTKWSSSYYKTGYKSSSKPVSNSSFWMSDDDLDKTSGKDLLKLAGYKRAIGNFVRIVTGKDNIPVSYSSGHQSYTDGKTVVLSAKLDEKEFDSIVGLALHEGSHIALTDFNYTQVQLRPGSWVMDKICNYYESRGIKVLSPIGADRTVYDIIANLKDIVNVIEDRRIDKYIYDAAPGYRGYYLAMYDKYFNAKEIDQALQSGVKNQQTWEDYMFHIINFANPNRKLSTLPGLQEIWDMIDIRNISRLKDTVQVFALASDVYIKIADLVDEPVAQAPNAQQPQNAQAGEGEGEGQDGQGSEEMSEGGNTPMQGEDGEDDPNLDSAGAASGAGSQADAKSSNQSQMTDRQKAALDKAIQKQKDFLRGNIKKSKMGRSDAEKINALESSDITLKTVGEKYMNIGSKEGKMTCVVVRGFTDAIVSSDICGSHIGDADSYHRNITRWGQRDYIAEGITLGTLLGKKLKTRDENRSLKTTRMETGRIDRRLIAELGFQNERVFSQTLHSTTTPSLIHISVDASGSMGGNSWNNSMKTAVAIAKAASMIQSLDVVISLRGTTTMGQSHRPLMWVVYDSRKDSFNVIKNKFCMLHAGGSTPEGLCYEAVLEDILKSANGRDAYLINLCDGDPGFSGSEGHYSGERALEHTRVQVDKMRKAGIAVIGYFISEVSKERAENCGSWRNFRKMYGVDSEHIDTNSLNQLAKSLNDKFIKKVA